MTTAKVDLAVEGRDDEAVVRRLLVARKVNPDDPRKLRVNVRRVEGKGGASGISELLAGMSAKIKSATGGGVGFVVDADADPTSRWHQVRDRMREQDVATPDDLPAEGFVGYTPRFKAHVGVWMMPDNFSAGAIEAFLLLMTQHQAAVVDHARNATVEARRLGAGFKDKDADKAVLYTYLAWQDEPSTLYGVAIACGALLAETPEADAFVAWVLRLLTEVGEDAALLI